jgi:hypothetical protein
MKRNPMRPRFSLKKRAWISTRRFGKNSTAAIGVSAVPIAIAIKIELIKILHSSGTIKDKLLCL